MSSFTAPSPAKLAAAPATSLLSGLIGWFQRSGARRAERSLQAERAQEAAAVRQYAQRFASHDPRFAADLLAAADRHERI